MIEDDYVTPKERRLARIAAVAMHVGFVVLLVVGVAWQTRMPEPVATVDLWESFNPPKPEPAPEPKPAPKVERKPEPKIERKPDPPKPQPKPEPPKPQPKPEPPPRPEVKRERPDIALKEKLERERREKEREELERKREVEKKRELERKREQELERKREQELARKKEEEKKLKAREALEARRLEDEKRKLEQERTAREAEAKRLAQEQADLKARFAKEQAARQASAIDGYVRQIQDKVRRNIVEPPNLQGNPEVVFEVRVLPGGELLEDTLRIKRSSGNPAYDQAVQRAILKASPLPVPSDPALFDRFRTTELVIRPR